MSRKQPCGCEIDSPMNGTVCLDHDIVYCPLHEAAPDMLVGLEDATAFLKNMSDDLLGHHPGECCCHRCNLVRLIAKVKGRNG